jgi:hypothetical protein
MRFLISLILPWLTFFTIGRPIGGVAFLPGINIQHRMAYEVFKKERVVRVLRMWTHYE